MKHVTWRGLAASALLPIAATAQTSVVGDDACPRYAVDIAAFATCDSTGVAKAVGVPTATTVARSHSAEHLTAQQAYAALRSAGSRGALVDVRSPIEVWLFGKPDIPHVHVPYREIVSAGSHWTFASNHRFGEQLMRELASRGIGPDDLVVIVCRSGEWSAAAADELADFGYSRIVSIVDGIEGQATESGQPMRGWRNAGLPWTVTGPTAHAASLAR